MGTTDITITDSQQDGSALEPLRHSAFLVLWLATVVSNIGTWMQNAAAGWLMTALTQDPLIVSLVQVATMLPVVLLGLPAGALADILDRRKLLISINTALIGIVAILAVLVGLGWINAFTLLIFTALVGAGSALIAPAWQAIVPSLVPRSELQAAVSLNSVGINISRAIGPALAGLLIGMIGMSAPFWVNAVSTVGVVAALCWWRPMATEINHLPAEHFGAALRVGLRHARHNPHLTATLMRAAGFFVFGSAYWALLPLIARDHVAVGPQLYGLLLGMIGAGAVVGAFVLLRLKAWLGPDLLVAIATTGTSAALVLFSLAKTPVTGFLASFVAGLCWIAVLAPINVSAQVALPAWVKGRGLALYATVQFAAMAAGSALWGQIAKMVGVPATLLIAAAGALIAIPLLWRFKLHTGAHLDLTPSMHWPEPVIAADVEPDRGPVQVTIEYEIDPADRQSFLQAISKLRLERLRDGVYHWVVYEDSAFPTRMTEMFLVPSWLEHQRQHQRVSHADREVQETVRQYHKGPTDPIVRHLVAVKS